MSSTFSSSTSTYSLTRPSFIRCFPLITPLLVANHQVPQGARQGGRFHRRRRGCVPPQAVHQHVRARRVVAERRHGAERGRAIIRPRHRCGHPTRRNLQVPFSRTSTDSRQLAFPLLPLSHSLLVPAGVLDPDMVSFVVEDQRSGGLQLLTRGHPTLGLARCSSYWDGRSICPFSDADRRKIWEMFLQVLTLVIAPFSTYSRATNFFLLPLTPLLVALASSGAPRTCTASRSHTRRCRSGCAPSSSGAAGALRATVVAAAAVAATAATVAAAAVAAAAVVAA